MQDRRALFCALDTELTDHVRNPNALFDLYELNSTQLKVVRYTLRIPRPEM
jgi:hypothetical protein